MFISQVCVLSKLPPPFPPPASECGETPGVGGDAERASVGGIPKVKFLGDAPREGCLPGGLWDLWANWSSFADMLVAQGLRSLVSLLGSMCRLVPLTKHSIH